MTHLKFNARLWTPGVLGAALLMLGVTLLSAQDKPKYTIVEVMKAVHKGEDSTGKKVSQGAGSKADFDKLVEYYRSLPLNDPPEGDPAAWKIKAQALLDAAQALRDGKPGALTQYNKAVNCKDCHSSFRPE